MALKPKQVECLKLMAKNPKIKGTELADILGVSEKTISQWKNHNDEFQEAYNSHVKKTIQYAALQAVEKQVELLESENDMVAHLAAKDLMDRAGYKPTDKVEQTVDMDLNITVDYGDNDDGGGEYSA